MTTVSDTDGGLPVLPEGLRWSVKEDSYGSLRVYLEKHGKFLGFGRWNKVREERVLSVWDDEVTDPRELRRKTIAVANEMLSEYTKRREVEAAKTAVLDSFTPKEAR